MIKFRKGYSLDDIRYYLFQWWWGRWNWIALRFSIPKTLEGEYKGKRWKMVQEGDGE